MSMRGIKLVLIFFLSLASYCSFSQSASEICNDGKDNNGDGKVDCADSQCIFAATIEKGCNCYDGKDNDGDGKIDIADVECAYYYGLTFVGSGSNCTVNPPPGTNVFTGISNTSTSSQNTSDTPAHISVGDMNGDGVPDAVVTSKWNSTVQVVATATTGSWSPGDIMGDFTTPGSKIFPTTGSDWVFEHETAIADIDGDKIGEMYVIASLRKGGPNNPPTGFALCGFKYASGKGNLISLFDAVSLGADRPGSIGLADFNGDGLAEVYLKNQIYDAKTGIKLADGGGVWDTQVNSGPVAVDMNSDGKLELVCGNYIYTVPTLTRGSVANLSTSILKDMNTLFTPKYYPKGYNDVNEYGVDHASTTSTADFDGDGNIDVFITGAVNCSGNEASPCGTNATTIFYWNVAKAKLQTFTPPDATYPLGWIWGTGRINLIDANGDGKLEALFTSGTKLFCLGSDASGNLVQLWVRTLNDALSGILSLTVYDFDNDGNPEVVYRDTQQLVVCDGKTGATTKWATTCQSHTFTEGPIIADVNGDGATDICIPCYTNVGAFDITKSTPQQQSLGQTHLYYTDKSTWLPTRQVWNQHPYFVTNINDNLTLPKTQASPDLIFSNGACPNGVPGPQRPFNLFMDQVPHLSKDGCPEFPAPDLTFYGDDPAQPGVDTNGDGKMNPTVVVIPPVCGNLNIQAYFNIINNGDLGISDNVPFSFFDGDPTKSLTGTITSATTSTTVTGTGTLFLTELSVGSTLVSSSGVTIGVVASIASNTSLTLVANAAVAVTAGSYYSTSKLYSGTFTITNLGVGQTYTSPTYTFNGTGKTFKLYIVIYNSGASLPIVLSSGGSTKECTITNNIYSVDITPTPFSVTVETLADNARCPGGSTDTGALRAHVFIGGVETNDYSPFAFQWYTGATTASPIGAPAGTQYNLLNRAAGTYSVVVTNTQKGCQSSQISGVVGFTGVVTWPIRVDTIRQTFCTPPNGEMTAVVTDGSVGYTYQWLDPTNFPIGNTTADVKNLTKGNYTLIVFKNGCNTQIPVVINGPAFPEARAKTLQNVVDCLSPNSGQVSADAYFNNILQPAANYTFDWYFFDNNTQLKGSQLPAANGTGQARTALTAGYYQAFVTDNTTKCQSLPLGNSVTQVTSSVVIPTAKITQVAPQTSCDPNQPNGILTAVGTAPGSVSPTDFTFEWYRGDNTLAVNKIPIGGGPESTSGTKGETLNSAKGGGTIYTVKVITSLNCSATDKLTLTENINVPMLTLTQLTPNSVCDVTKATNPYNGSIKATVTFGVDGLGNPISVTLPDPNYTFSWYDGTTTTTAHTPPTSSSNILGGLKDGNYAATVTRTDLHCTSVPQTTPVVKATVLPQLSATSTGSNNCDPTLTPDGTVTVAVTNSVPGDVFTYQWYKGNVVGVGALGAANNGTSATAIKVGGPVGAPNPYTVYVLNTTTGCENNTTQFVADNSVIPVLTFTNVTPNSICAPSTNFNGSLTTTVTNIPASYTIADYTFKWYNGATNASPVNGTSTGVTLSKLDAGSYTVEGTNTKTGCKSSPYTNVVPNAKIFPSLLPASTGSNNCDPALTPDGTVTYTVNNIQPGDVFTQQWYNGSGDPNLGGLVALGAANNGTSVTAIKLGGPVGAPKSYTVLVTNTTTGCTNYTTATVADVSVVPVLTTSTTPNAMCDPTKFNGTMSTNVTNIPALYTIADYTFKWYDGNTIAILHNPQPSPTTLTTLSKLDAGTYSVIGTNTKTGCVSALSTNTVGNTKIFPTLLPASTGSNNCDPALTPDGTVTYSVTNIQPGDAFTQQWYNGSGDPNLGGLATLGAANNGTSVTAIKVGGPVGAPKSYTVLVTNTTTGCTNYAIASVADVSVVPVLTTSTTPNAMCDPTKFNGTMSTNVTNIPALYTIADYTFKWYDGNTSATLHSPQPSPTTLTTLSQLDAGTYSVIGTNTKTGCVSALSTNTVGNIKIFPTLLPASTGSNNCDPALTPDGTVTYSVTNIQAGDAFTQQWYVGSGDPIAGAFAKVPTNPNNGTSITAIKLGGPTGAPHPYTVFVTNTTTGCTNYTTVMVADVSVIPVLSTSTTPNDMCDPTKFDGTMSTAVTNIPAGYTIADYNFTWKNSLNTIIQGPSAATLLSSLDAGTYTVFGINTKTGCQSAVATNQVQDQKVYPILVMTSTGSHNCSAAIVPDGTATATVSNAGADTFTYAWTAVAPAAAINNATNNANQPTAIKLGGPTNAPNTYSAVVTNNRTGCKTTEPVQVADLSAKPTLSLQAFDNHVCDKTLITSGPQQFDGHVDVVSVTNNTGSYAGSITYRYDWNDVTNATTLLTNSTATTITNLDNGTFSSSVTITELGCVSDPVTAQVLDNLTIPAVVTAVAPNVNCVAPFNGSAQVATIDGSAVLTNYSINWYNGGTVSGASISTNAILGTTLQGPSVTYTAQATKKTTGCQGNTSATVVDSKVTPTISLSVVQDNTVCDLTTIDPNGQLLATVGSVGASYTITWAGGVAPATVTGANSQNYTKLKTGAYSAHVKDNSTGCQSVDDNQNIVDNLIYPVINVTETDQTSCTATPNGSLSVATVAGVTYAWFDGVGTGAAHTPSVVSAINNLAAADYTVEATITATGCVSTQTNTVAENIVYPQIDITGIGPVTKCNTPDGSATVTFITPLPAKYDIFYVFTSTSSGASYPTTPAVIEASTDPRNQTDATLAPTAYTGMEPGYLTSIVIDKTTSCVSAPVTKQIADGTTKSNITLTIFASPGICGSGFGGLDPVVTPLAAVSYTYKWFVGAPTNATPINFFNNPPTFVTPQIYGDNGANLGIHHAPPDNSISPGTFTLVVTDPDGCGTYKTDNVPTSTIPTIVMTPTDVTTCDIIPNGQMKVTVTTGTSLTGYSIKLFSGNNNAGTLKGSLPLSAINTPLTVLNLSDGPYFAEVIDGDNPGCPIGKNQSLAKLVLPPIVTLNNIGANTSCDPNNSADGSVNLTVNSDATDVQAKVYQVSVTNPVIPTYATPNTIGNGNSGQSETIPGMSPVSYTITVFDANSHCSTDVNVNIPNQQDVPDLLNLTPTPETDCAPSSNGSAIASLNNAESTTHFDFSWYSDNAATLGVYLNATGTGTPAGGEQIDQTKVAVANWPMGSSGQGSGNRMFYVQGVKNAAAVTGVGCKTQLEQVVIPDQHVSPDMTLATAFNSFCNATAANGIIGDGKITVVADSDPSTGAQDIPAAGFDYSWTNANAGLASPQNSSVASFVIPKLGTGSYQVTATNATNKCSVVNNATIDPAPYVITINTSSVMDQQICNADGQIDVTKITVDRSAETPPPGNIVETNATPLTTSYDFEWYPATAGNPGTFTAGTQLKDNTATIINQQSLVTGAGAGQYANMAAGTYYVVATRKATAAVAAGCPSLPYRVDVKDVHQNPVPTLVAISNTSCLPAGPGEGEITIQVADNTNAAFLPFTYTYDNWTGTTVIPTTNANNGNASSADGDGDHPVALIDGAYTFRITNNKSGCSVNASATIVKNAVPVFVQSVTTVDQVLCAADGSVTVTKVSLNDRNGVSQVFDNTTTPNISDFEFDWNRTASGFTQTTPGTALDNATYNTAGFGTPLGADTYTVVARRVSGSPGTGCTSAPFTATIFNKQILPVVSLTPLANTSCDPLFFEGEIKVVVTDASVNLPAPLPGSPYSFDYQWTTSPTAIGNTAGNDGDGFGGGELDAGSVMDNDGDHPTGLIDGTYVVSVTNTQTQCSSTGTTTIFKNGTPVFTQLVTTTDQVLCGPDGKFEIKEVRLIDRNGNVKSNLNPPPNDLTLADFDFDWLDASSTLIKTTSGSNGAVSGGTILDNNPVTGYGSLQAGTYYVVTRRVAGNPGKDCQSAPYKVDILDKRVFPQVSLTPLANTSCDPLFFEGEIKVAVTDASVNLPAPLPGSPYSFDYQWTTAPTAIGNTAGNDGDGFGGGELDAGSVMDNDGDHPTGLMDGTYVVSVTNTQTQCSSTGTTTIFKNGTPVFTQLVTATDQVLCSADGKLEVKEVRLIDRSGNIQSSISDFSISDFAFTYDRGSVGTTVLGPDDPSTILDKTNYNSIGFGTYFVTSKRVNGAPGKDCSSAPYKVDILDKRAFPVPSLTPFANTSCDPAFFEGEITISVSDGTTATGPFTFTYAWDNVNNPMAIVTASPGTNNGDASNADGDEDNPKGLKDGTYTITVTNNQTQCQGPGTTTIFRNSTPVFTQLVTSTPQVFCSPDGTLDVQEVKIIDRNGVVQSNLNTPPDFPLSDFAFSYDRTTIGNTILTNSASTQLSNVNYPTIGFDTYYVVATRVNGNPGKSCSSAPYKIDIIDQRLYPKVDFTSQANSSCNVAKPNGSVTAIASEQNGSNSDPYTFNWTLNGQAIGSVSPTPPTQTDTSPKSVLTNALDGDYIATVTNTNTGCPFAASFNLELDQTRSTPNIIDVQIIKPTDCNPSATAEVTKITLGSVTNSSQIPPFATNVIDQTSVAPALIDFTYTWYEGTLTNVLPQTTAPCIGPGCPTPTVGVKYGTHFVTVIDPRTDCTSNPKEFDVPTDNIIYPDVNIAETIPQISCDPLKGTAQLQATAIEQDGTTGTYLFTWYPTVDFQGTPIASSPGIATDNPNFISNLLTGNYSVKVQNTVSSCIDSAFFVVPDDSPLFKPEISATASPLTFCVGLDGDAQVRIDLNPLYPLLPYNSSTFQTDLYRGSTPNLNNPPDVATNMAATPSGSASAITYDKYGLTNDFYTFKVTDLNTGCVVSATTEVQLNQNNPVIDIVLDNPSTKCDPAPATGQLSATADGGQISGYLFDWYPGTTVATPPGAYIVEDNKLIGQKAGDYVVRVINSFTGCFDDKTSPIPDLHVTPPMPIASSIDRTSCIIPNGETDASVGGDVIDYEFDWYDGNSVTSSFAGPNYIGLDTGYYSVTAKDLVTLCVSPKATVHVNDGRIIPQFELTSTASFCDDPFNPSDKGTGTLTLTLTNNVTLDSVVWTYPAGNVVGIGTEVFDLFPSDPGTSYHVEAYTTEGCVNTGDVVIDTEIHPFNLVSSNGDAKNDYFIIDCMSNFPNNNVKIFNRNGTLVFEADGYGINPDAPVFRGVGEKGIYLGGKELPDGTYFYIIDKRDGSKPKAGFLELIR